MTMFYVVIAVAVSVIILTWLALRSGRSYSVHDTEAHATTYADTIKEGHGRLTAFIWVCFLVIFIFTIFYLVQHAGEFSVIFSR